MKLLTATMLSAATLAAALLVEAEEPAAPSAILLDADVVPPPLCEHELAPLCEHELASIEEAKLVNANCRSTTGASHSWSFEEPIAVKKGDVIRLFGPKQQKVEVWRKVEERKAGE